MGVGLTREEQEVVQALQNNGLTPSGATLAVVMLTRGHMRPARELADIVSQYPNLEGHGVADQCIRQLTATGWLINTSSNGLNLTQKALDLADKMKKVINDPEPVDILLQSLSSLPPLMPNIHILGPMSTTPEVYSSYIHLLQNAQHEICLPMLATSPKLYVVSILQDRAHQGVNVRILLASPKVAAKFRGATIKTISQEAISGWIQNAKGYPRMEVRIAHLPEDMLFATSWLADGKLLRFDIYDPSKQRSLEGVMIEVQSPYGLQLNLVDLFQARFNEAWERAEPTTILAKLKWWLGRGWQWWAFLAAIIIAGLLIKNPLWSGLAISVAATFLVNAIVSSWPTLLSFIRRKLLGV